MSTLKPRRPKSAKRPRRRPPVVQAETPVEERWRSCLHEGGHVVVGLLATAPEKRCFGGAVIRRPVSCCWTPLAVRRFDEGVVIAAGAAAEALARSFLPPGPLPNRTALAVTVRAVMRSRVGKKLAVPGPSDTVALAAWAVKNHEHHPDAWAGRWTRARYEAEGHVQQHARRIIAAADLLFLAGAVLPRDVKIILGPLGPLPESRIRPKGDDRGDDAEKQSGRRDQGHAKGKPGVERPARRGPRGG